MGWEKGPQISQWIKSKVKMDIWLKYGKGSHFSLAMGQTRQSLLLWKLSTSWMIDCKVIILLSNTWPNPICHRYGFKILEETKFTKDLKIDCKTGEIDMQFAESCSK